MARSRAVLYDRHSPRRRVHEVESILVQRTLLLRDDAPSVLGGKRLTSPAKQLRLIRPQAVRTAAIREEQS
jgi:hypothetical protein